MGVYRTTEPRRRNARLTASCRLLADVPEPAKAAGSVSGVVRPDGPITAAPAYEFGDGDAFGVRFDTPVALGPRLPASRLPITGPHQLQPPKPHPLLNYYTADALHRGSVCKVQAYGGGLRANAHAQRLLRELVAGFGKPAAKSTPTKYVWDLSSVTARVILEPGPRVTIEFKNYIECEAEDKAAAELDRRTHGKWSEEDLKDVLVHEPPVSPR